MGREGWLAIMDADVVWPAALVLAEFAEGNLYGPRRRMMTDVGRAVPEEKFWGSYPLHGDREYAGYSQIFHAEDPHLGIPPWHEVNWRHAGGGDSFFQALWPEAKKIRLPWEVLHLGEAGKNWCGRATRLTSGELPAESEERGEKLRGFISHRKDGPHRFSGEKILLDNPPDV